jgi:hypothetical protein
LVGAKHTALAEEVIYEGSFSVVNMRYDSDIAEVLIVRCIFVFHAGDMVAWTTQLSKVYGAIASRSRQRQIGVMCARNNTLGVPPLEVR